jgi:type I restriction enzyme S subunit
MHFLESPVGKQQIMDKCEVGARFRLPFNSLSKISMNLPSLEVQTEIVQILDQFTQLEIGLESELVARSSQFEYCKETLFERVSNHEFVTLESICSRITSGGTPATSNRDFYEGSIPWVRTSEVDFRAIESTEIHISEDALKQSSAKWIPAQSVIMAMVGATIGKVAYTEIDVTTNQNCCNLIVDPKKAFYKYVFFWLWSQYETIKASAPGAVPNINSSAIKRLQIPLPPLEEQIKIATALSSLQELIQSPISGIPAELNARKKQYEFYRSKLLTFGELGTI